MFLPFLLAATGGLYGDECSTVEDCHFAQAVCHDALKTCQCHPDVPISNYKDKCGKAASVNETCMFNEQCEDVNFKTECKNERCACKYDMVPEVTVDGAVICTYSGLLLKNVRGRTRPLGSLLNAANGGLYGDQCSTEQDCHFAEAVCHDVVKTCQCHPDVPISNYKDKCGKAASINETCMFNEQCEDVNFKTECKNGRCACKYDMVPEVTVDGTIICASANGGLHGDQCSTVQDCHFAEAVCHDVLKTCQCHPDVPISNYKDKCGKAASINETCMFNEQCEDVNFKAECKNGRCACKFNMVPEVTVDGTVICAYSGLLLKNARVT
ncbi:hypothetical protein PYW07_001470 [Mythimna separata]|uniref:EB domain-containing protein n=1 Tax=Mythimna separata TaxID=271217 RepID=A0AAD7YT88_MYTSE|nr:hypothetical protein PYW07_001470 [Mythimna separata]